MLLHQCAWPRCAWYAAHFQHVFLISSWSADTWAKLLGMFWTMELSMVFYDNNDKVCWLQVLKGKAVQALQAQWSICHIYHIWHFNGKQNASVIKKHAEKYSSISGSETLKLYVTNVQNMVYVTYVAYVAYDVHKWVFSQNLLPGSQWWIDPGWFGGYKPTLRVDYQSRETAFAEAG